MGKRFSGVSEMVKNISEEEQFKTDVKRAIKDRTISEFLFSQRCKCNLTQKQLAEKVSCSQSRLSKIETASNKELSIDDLLLYSKGLNLKLEIGFRHDSVNLVDLIKYHVLKIKEYLTKLRALADGDEAMTDAIGEFHVEALMNFENMVLKSYSELKMKPLKDKSTIHISAPFPNGVGDKEKSECIG